VSLSLGRVTVETDAAKAVADADLVIEAIVENLETKQRLFAALDSAAPRFTVESTTSSSSLSGAVVNGWAA